MSKKFIYFDATIDGETESLAYETTDYVASSAGVGDAGKPIVLDAAGNIDASMLNDADIDHGGLTGLGDDDHTQYSLVDGTRAYTGIVSYNSHPSFTADTQIVDKKYVDDVLVTSEWFYKSALDYVVDNTAVPATEVTGDVYVLSHDGGTPNAAWDGASAGDIVEFNGTTWDATTPATGTRIGVDDEANVVFYLWGGSSWTPKYEESTTASTGLTKVGFDIRLDASSAGDGLGFSSGVLSVNVDDSSLEIATDTLQVKALGITNAMLAGSIADGKLASDYIQTSEVDDATIEFTGSTLNVKADGINDTHIDFGTGTNQVSAVDLPIADGGGYFTATDVEAALQEIGAELDAPASVSFTSAGVTKGDLVYISANDTVDNMALTIDDRPVGLAATTVAASSPVSVVQDQNILTGVLTTATAGDVYYWDGSAHTTTAPTTSGNWVIQTGIAANATDLFVDVIRKKKNS